MNIHEILQQEGWELSERTKWIAVRDDRPALKKFSPQGRIGKIVGNHFYVTLVQLNAHVEKLICEAGVQPRYLPSTKGGSERQYIGIDTSAMPREVFTVFIKKLHAAVDAMSEQVSPAQVPPASF